MTPLDQLAYKIADESSITLIECEFGRDDHVTYSMDENAVAQSPMLEEAVEYLTSRGLVQRADGDGMVVLILEDDE